MEHRVASRFDEKYKNDRCPICKFMDQNFIYISDKELSCYSCGIIFINKESRDAMKRISLEMLIAQKEDKRFRCECGFEAKSRAGLVAHKRKCNSE